MDKFRFNFKPVDKAHRSLVHHWLTQPHVTEWFYGQGLENTFKHLDAFLDGSLQSRYWLAFDKKHPFAFLITSSVCKPEDELTCWCTEEGDAITLDMLIGDHNYLGKGLSHILIQEFLVSQFPQVAEVLIDPEATNSRAIHVYQKAGFTILDEFIPSHSPNKHYMMRLNMKKLKEVIPPWVYAPGYEPGRAFWRQEGEPWFVSVWVPYWESLNSQERKDYLKKWNVPEVWQQFSYHINPEFKDFLDSID